MSQQNIDMVQSAKQELANRATEVGKKADSLKIVGDSVEGLAAFVAACNDLKEYADWYALVAPDVGDPEALPEPPGGGD